jgi:hypothetical protein
MKPLETDVHQPDGVRTNGDRAQLEAFSHLALINAVMHVIHAELGVPNKFGVGSPAPQP